MGRKIQWTEELRSWLNEMLISDFRERGSRRTVWDYRKDLRNRLIEKARGEQKVHGCSDEDIVAMVDGKDKDYDEYVLVGPSRISKHVTATWKELEKQLRSLTSMDQAWSAGNCLDDNLPLGTVGTIVSVQRGLAQVGRYLTRRHVKWLTIMEPILSSTLTEEYADVSQRESALLQIVSLYSLRHQIVDLENKKGIPTDGRPVTTADLDRTFVIGQDVSFPTILREWLSVFCPIIAEGIEKGPSDIDQKGGPGLAPADTPLGEFQRLVLDAITDSRGRGAVVEFVMENPEVTPFAQRWLAFNLRRWLVKNWQTEHQKEKHNGKW